MVCGSTTNQEPRHFCAVFFYDTLAAAQATPIHADMRKTVGTELHGDGTETDKFRSILVP